MLFREIKPIHTGLIRIQHLHCMVKYSILILINLVRKGSAKWWVQVYLKGCNVLTS